MANYTAKKLSDMQAAFGGGFVKVRAEVGVTAFGVQVIRMPPNYDDYPAHDHTHDGQEELYVALDGSGWLEIEGERVELGREDFVRVGPEVRRQVHSGPEGLSMMVIGGRPGGAYEIAPFSELETA